jgi:hypothetical protein
VTVSQGSWDWYSFGNVTYNFFNPVSGYFGGQLLPAGWYFLNSLPEPPDDDPDQTVGDISNCDPDSSSWKVCFTVTTLSECDDNIDCSVSIKSFADGEIGSFVSKSCGNDELTEFSTFLSCCLNPAVSPIFNKTICSGDTLNIFFSSNIPSPVYYEWEVSNNENIIGAMSGEGSFLRQRLFNFSDEVQEVRYDVIGQGEYCQSPTESFTVNILPAPTALLSLAGPDEICIGEESLLRIDLTGNSPFIIEFAVNGESLDQFVTESDLVFLPVSPEENSVYTINYYSDGTCGGVSAGTATIDVLPVSQVSLSAEICDGESVAIGETVFENTGQYQVILENAADNGCDSIIDVNLTVHPLETTDISTTICPGFAFLIGGTAYTESGLYIETIPSSNGCDSTVTLNLTVSAALTREINHTICFGGSFVFGGDTLTSGGIYTDTFPINDQCDSVIILNLSQVPKIDLIETTVQTDDGDGSGAITIELTGGIPPYLFFWSTGDTTQNLSGLVAGSYMLIVSDAFNCLSEFEFVVQLSTGLEDMRQNLPSVSVYPSPVKSGEQFVIDINNKASDARTVDLDILQLDGKIIQDHQLMLQPGNLELRLTASMKPGIYYAVIREGNYQVIEPIIVQ